MFKKTYTTPTLKTIALAADSIICASGSKESIELNKDSYTGEYASGTHQWDSSNWSETDEE